MFRLTATLRGVPLYLLEESGLFPQITTLGYSWYARYDHARKQAKPKHWLMFIGCLLIPLPIYLYLAGAESSADTKLFLIGCLCIALRIKGQPWQFAKAIRRLDECLKETDHRGIYQLPVESADRETFLIGEAVERIKYILYYGKKDGCDSELEEFWCQRLEELDDIATEFGHILGDDKLHYQRAEKELKTGEDALAKNYQALEERP